MCAFPKFVDNRDHPVPCGKISASASSDYIGRPRDDIQHVQEAAVHQIILLYFHTLLCGLLHSHCCWLTEISLIMVVNNWLTTRIQRCENWVGKICRYCTYFVVGFNGDEFDFANDLHYENNLFYEQFKID